MNAGPSSKVTIRSRVGIVYRLLLLGLDRQRIIDHVCSKYPSWPKSESTIDRYIKRANVLLEQAGVTERPVEFGRSLARKHDIFARCMQDKDYRGALAAQKEIDELLGLKAPVKIDVASERERLVEFMVEDVMREASRATAEAQSGD